MEQAMTKQAFDTLTNVYLAGGAMRCETYLKSVC